MFLPSTYLEALLLLIFSVVCWGSWANMQKLLGRRRFEVYYFDYSLGVVLCAVVAAFTLGSMKSQELTFQDNLLVTGYHNMAYAAGAGVIFNLANLLLVAAISVSGMAVAFPIGIGLALVIVATLNFFPGTQANPILLFSGVLLVLLAIVLNASTFSAYVNAQWASSRKTVPTGQRPAGPRIPSAAKGIGLSVAAGIFMSLVYPVLALATTGEAGVGPYGTAVLFSGGVLFSTIVYMPFFLTFPVHGRPVGFAAYFKGTSREHLLGLLGGIIWMAGGLANLTVASAPSAVQMGPAVSYELGQGATLVGALWGLLVWREFPGSSGRIKALLAAMFLLLAAGVAMVTIAPLRP